VARRYFLGIFLGRFKTKKGDFLLAFCSFFRTFAKV